MTSRALPATVITAFAAGVVVACGSGSDDGTARTATSTDVEPRMAAARTAAVTRNCDSRVEGGQSPPQRSDVVVGPVTFNGLRAVARQPSSDFRPRRGRYLAWKSVTEVKAEREVTLVVPRTA